jgi:flagellar hook-length control protein FliK
MGGKVSVTTRSAAGSGAGRALDPAAASRDGAAGAAPANGFSSALSAAARPAPREAGGDAHADPAPTTAAQAGAKSQAPRTSAATSNPSGSQVQTAAATVVAAQASSIEADLTTQEDQPPEKSTGRSRANDNDSSLPADPTMLAFLLAAGALQIDLRAAAGQQHSTDSSATSDEHTAAAIVGNVPASTPAAAALASPASAAQSPAAAVTATAGSAAPGIAAPVTAEAAAAAAATPALQVEANSLSATGASNILSAPDASLLQNKSAAPDGMQPQPASSAAGGVAEMMRGLSAGATQAAGAERTVSVPVSDRNWSGAVAGQVQWMVSNNLQSATLQLSPEHLGPVEVRIDVQSSQVNVSFTASHPDTRSALEQSLPQLRAILANGGLTLGQATVQQEARSGSHYAPSTSRSALSAAQSVDSVSVSSTRGLGLIDEYV